MIKVELCEGFTIQKVQSVLNRMGIGNNDLKTLSPSCYIFEIGSRTYLAHFKELLILEKGPDSLKPGERNNITEEDLFRRNNIAELIESWGFLKIKSTGIRKSPKQNLKVLQLLEKKYWTIKHKYTL